MRDELDSFLHKNILLSSGQQQSSKACLERIEMISQAVEKMLLEWLPCLTKKG